MKKSVIKVLLVLILLASIMLITSCTGGVSAGQRPVDTAAALKIVQTGSQGVEIKFLQNSPPPVVYDQNELVALVEVNNKGNFNLEGGDCFIQVSGFDPNILKGGFGAARSCAENAGVLEGKNVYNLDGGTNQLEFKSSNIALPQGVFDYNPILNFVSCYIYRTTANPSVCLDPLFYQVTAEQKTCIPKDVGMGGGQGGPVGISYVGIDMIGGKAVFEINVQNFGTGRVLSPYVDIHNCGQSSVEYTDLDKVEYYVTLSGVALNCKPMDHMVRLNNNMGKIVCTGDLPSSSAYETPLTVDLNYGYIQSWTKPIKIVRTPGS